MTNSPKNKNTLENTNSIIYRPRLKTILGSITAAILLQQIIYWYNKYGTFYKFNAPCNHQLYQPGKSWVEELEFSKHELDSALKKIGQKLTKENKNKPHAKPVEYWINSERITFYKINEKNLNNIFLKAYPGISNLKLQGYSRVDLKTGVTKSRNLGLLFQEEITSKEITKDYVIAQNIPSNLINYVTNFYSIQKKKFPNAPNLRKISKDDVTKSAKTLLQLIRIDKFDFRTEIKPTIEWALDDDFWQDKILSLANLRSKSSRNSQTKFYNIFSSMQSELKRKKNHETRSYNRTPVEERDKEWYDQLDRDAIEI